MHVIRAAVKTQTFIRSRVDRRRQEQDVVSLQEGQVHTTSKSTPGSKWPIKTFIVRSSVVVLPVMSSSVEPTAPVRGEEQEGNGFSLFPSNPAVLPREKGNGGKEGENFPFFLICSRSTLGPATKFLPRVRKLPGKARRRPSNVSPEE